MDDHYAPRPVAGWFMFAAATSLLFMLAICVLYGIHLTTDPATLPIDERAVYEAEPSWVSGAFGLTGLTGAFGAIMLLLKKKAAVPLLLVSLLAVIVWFVGLFAVPKLRDLLVTGEIAMALIVAAVTWTIYWFARHSRQRGWLR